MPHYEKTANELVHDEIRKSILNGELDTVDQRNSYELPQTISLRYKELYKTNNVLKVHRYRCRQFFLKYYKPLLVDFRFHFKIFNIDGVKNIGIFASRQIVCNDYLYIDCLKGYRGQHISELKSINSHSVFKATLFPRIVKCDPNKRRLEQYYILLGSISLINHGCNNCSNCEPFNQEYKKERTFLKNNFLKIRAKRAIKEGEELLISYGDEESVKELGYICYKCKS